MTELSEEADRLIRASAGPPKLGELPRKIATLEQRVERLEKAAEFRGHRGHATSPCGGLGKCTICEALAE